MKDKEFEPTKGEVEVDETNENGRLTSQLDDSIGLSRQKLRNSLVQELTLS